MKNNLYVGMLALAALSAGSYLCSCSTISQAVSSVRSVDMSQYPGLSVVAEAQKEMMGVYSQSSKLLLQSRLAAVEALVIDAEAIAANEKAGDVYASAKKIASNGREKQQLLLAQITNITNAQDMDAIDKAKEATEGIDSMIAEGYNELSKATSSTNAQIASTNKKGDYYIAQAIQHQAKAAAKIRESHSLLQDAQMKELELAATASLQTAALVKGLAGASTIEKTLLAVQFRPIVYFLTGLPGEFNEQTEVKKMWEEHAEKSDIKLNKKKIGSIDSVVAKGADELKGAISLDSFMSF